MTTINEPQRVANSTGGKPPSVANQGAVAPGAEPQTPPKGSSGAAGNQPLPAQRAAPTGMTLPAWSPPSTAAAAVPSYSDTFGNHGYVKDGSNPAMLGLMSRAVAANPQLASGPLGQGVKDGHVGPQQVKALQDFLQSKGYSVGSKGVDGKFGPDTHAALASMLNGQPPQAAKADPKPANTDPKPAAVPPKGETPADPGKVKQDPVVPPKDAPASTPTDNHTAVYDVSSHTVTLPDGTKLEAHSGRGDAQDDPNSQNQRNKGTTPTGVYKLTPREARYHGVAALRLTPVNGTNTHGRDGLLAHTYMLGPKGESHGCVVFKNYPAFLKAYNSGQINQIKIVP